MTKHMYTTMNCDFVENEYYYSHSSGQGESQQPILISDPLNWLHIPAESPHPSKTIQGETQQGGEESREKPNPSTEEEAEKNNHTNELSQSTSQTTEFNGVTQPSTPSSNPEVNDSETNTVLLEITNTDRIIKDGETNSRNENNKQYELPHRITRGIPPKRYSPDWKGRKTKYSVANIAQGHLTEMARAFEAALYEEEEIPQTFQEAVKHKHWREAMKKEIDALIKNGTWEKCNLPEEKKPVGCRWIFTIKRRADGSIERYKARLVAKGYTQVYGIDYDETFSPVAKLDTIRALLSVAACKDWSLHQFDVTNAFLHGELEKDKEVYMAVPPGFDGEFGPRQVCRLKKTLYGLKQSPRIWFGRFCQAMIKHGYKQSLSDHTLFTKRRGDKITCLIIYVDDMIITGDDTEEINNLKINLFKEFDMKDLGPLKYFLGIEVLRSRHGIFLRQRKYVLDLLAETGLLDCKPADTPMMPNHGLKIVEGAESTDQEKYQRLVGKLLYLSHTRPDIAYAVGVISQFMHRPQEEHMNAALRIVRYLKGTINYGVFLKRGKDLEVDGYTDADWASNPVDRRSTGGYFTFIGGNLVTWRSKKQKVVALSSAEAEFRGIKSGLTEIMWLRRLLTEIGFSPNRKSKLFCDNKAAISISENPVQHDRTKHVEIDRHFIKEKLEGGIIEFPFVRSEEQLADILTKAVNPKSFREILAKLNIGDTVAQLEGECQNESPNG